MLGGAKWETFAERRFVDLDHLGARAFQVERLASYSERDLLAGDRSWLVVAHEGPLEDGDRTGEHALYRLWCAPLSVLPPAHRHRRWTVDISVEDGRLDAAGAVGLNPPVGGNHEAIQVLGKVLNHVVAFGFTVYQYVQSHLFLATNDRGDLIP